MNGATGMAEKKSASYLLLPLLALFACAAEKSPPPDLAVPPPRVISGPSKSSPHSYFPLASGNRWTFRCRLGEGELFEKTLELRGSQTINGVTYYRAAQILPDGEQTFYLSRDPQGVIWKTMEAAGGERQRFAVEQAGGPNPPRRETKVAAFGEIEMLVLENFWPDDPHLPENQRLEEWQAVYFAPGIGPAAEADGAGGGCELVAYEVR